MKTIELSTASGTLAEYARDMDDELVVLMSNNKPVAAIVSLKGQADEWQDEHDLPIAVYS